MQSLYNVHEHNLFSYLERWTEIKNIVLYCIVHGIEGLHNGMHFKYKTDNITREHSWALVKEWCELDIRKYAFSQRTTH